MKNLVLVLALLLSATIPALAQTNTNQSRIIDINGVGVPDVMITERSSCASATPPTDASATKIYFTDANGNFRWPAIGLPGGGSQCAVTVSYGFILSKEGFTFTSHGQFGYKPGPAIFP